MELQDILSRSKRSRRSFLAGAGAVGAAGAATLLTGCNDSTSNMGGTTTTTPAPLDIPDNDILNFALNLEYLEAEFYLRAATGSGLPSALLPSGSGSVTGGSAVAGLSTAQQAYLNAIAQDEMNHVAAIQATISANSGTPVARPNIDLSTSFNTLASAAGIGSSFNPFSSGTNLLLGAFIFEDVGVTAYNGAAPYITSSKILDAAAGIVAVEAYHAAEVRTQLVGIGSSAVLAIANQIAALRATVSLGNTTVNASSSLSAYQAGGETILSNMQIVNADANAVGFSRTTAQVLKIVYAGGTSSGGFFPQGLNGTIKSAS